MIKYTLKCGDDHTFESWFANAAAFDSLKAAGHVVCAVCGSDRVAKAIMAPRVSTGIERVEAPVAQTPAEPAAQGGADLSRMRAEVEKNATYVGKDFARDARDMHLGDVPDRPIWGEASLQEAKSLIEDGVPVAPLPFGPSRKVN